MTPDHAKRLVVLGTLGTGVLTSAASLHKRHALPGIRVAVGVFGAGVLLAGLAELEPALAGAFAVLMLATAAFGVGPDAWSGITAITKGT